MPVSLTTGAAARRAAQRPVQQQVLLLVVLVWLNIDQPLAVAINDRDVVQAQRGVGRGDDLSGLFRAALAYRLEKGYVRDDEAGVVQQLLFDLGEAALDDIDFFVDLFAANFLRKVLRVAHQQEDHDDQKQSQYQQHQHVEFDRETDMPEQGLEPPVNAGL